MHFNRVTGWRHLQPMLRMTVTAFTDKSTLIENIIDSLRTPPRTAAAFQSCAVQCKIIIYHCRATFTNITRISHLSLCKVLPTRESGRETEMQSKREAQRKPGAQLALAAVALSAVALSCAVRQRSQLINTRAERVLSQFVFNSHSERKQRRRCQPT